ncbi:MAG: hypothetical protein AB8F94_06415 [Saprospiraceae bacterium]
MKNEDDQILDEGIFSKTKQLSNRQLASLVQTKVRYPNYILSRIDVEINRRNLDKNDLLKENLLEKNKATTKERFLFFYKKNKTATIFLSIISFASLFTIPWVFFVIIFSIYFSLKKTPSNM